MQTPERSWNSLFPVPERSEKAGKSCSHSPFSLVLIASIIIPSVLPERYSENRTRLRRSSTHITAWTGWHRVGLRDYFYGRNKNLNGCSRRAQKRFSYDKNQFHSTEMSSGARN